MNTQLISGGGGSPIITRRVYYTGTDTLYEGYGLCYNFAARDQSPEGLTKGAEGCTISLADSLVATPARRIQVQKPSWRNAAHFAGVVSNKSNGVKGPGFIEIHVPGSVVNIYCEANAKHEETLLSAKANTGSILTFTTGSYAFKHQGLAGAGSAILLGTVDRSSTAGLVQALLMDGPQSGGVQEINADAMASLAAVSLGGSIFVTPFGVTLNISGATLTCSLHPDTGKPLPYGALKIFRNIVSTAASGIAITASSAILLAHSLAAGSINAIEASVHTTSLINNSASFMWNGVNWVLYDKTKGTSTLGT